MYEKIQRKYDFMKFEMSNLKILYKDSFRDISNIDAESTFKNFCNQCYHFKDWLIKEFPQKKEHIENYISSNKWLSICADFTNQDKHRELSKKPRHKKVVGHGSNHTFINLTNNGFTTKSHYEVRVGDEKIGSLKIAQESFNAWNQYLTESKINIK